MEFFFFASAKVLSLEKSLLVSSFLFTVGAFCGKTQLGSVVAGNKNDYE
jgi:hypothetical protein